VKQRILALDPRTYRRHRIHVEERVWAETNCYMDVWIELLHALGHEPIAVLPFTFAIDFEGDQWTFFKCPLGDLTHLYDIDVQELALWRPLVAHLEEQVQRGRLVLVELDSYFLPDTVGTAYKQAHVKSTVAVNEIDAAGHSLGYFHNQGYYRLEGEDFLDLLRLRGEPDPAVLPPYAEFVKIRHSTSRRGISLRERSLQLFRKHLEFAPAENPFPAFRERFEKDLVWLMQEDLDSFHRYAFATLRQYGACFELSQTYLQWLASQGEQGLDEAIHAFGTISESAKSFQFQLARALSRRKALDLSPLTSMSEYWQAGTSSLKARYL